MAAQTWHFKVEGVTAPVVPHFQTKIVSMVSWSDMDGRTRLSGQPIRVLEVQIPDRKDRTLEQYRAVKAAVAGLEQVLPVRTFEQGGRHEALYV